MQNFNNSAPTPSFIYSLLVIVAEMCMSIYLEIKSCYKQSFTMSWTFLLVFPQKTLVWIGVVHLCVPHNLVTKLQIFLSLIILLLQFSNTKKVYFMRGIQLDFFKNFVSFVLFDLIVTFTIFSVFNVQWLIWLARPCNFISGF